MTWIGDAYWFSLSPAIPFQILFYRWMFPFSLSFSFFVHPSSIYTKRTYNSLSVCVTNFVWNWVRARVYLYVCERSIMRIFFISFLFQSSSAMAETIPFLSTLLHILARLHTCINKRIPNIWMVLAMRFWCQFLLVSHLVYCWHWSCQKKKKLLQEVQHGKLILFLR